MLERSIETHAALAMIGDADAELVATGNVRDGLYEDVADADYRAWPRLSKSILEYGMTSMIDLKAAVEGKMRRDTSAMAFGRAFHSRLLTPHTFADQFDVAGQCVENTAKGERCSKRGQVRVGGKWVCEIHGRGMLGDKIESLSEQDNDTIEGMRHSVLNHKAVKLLRQAGGAEVSIAWTGFANAPMKARMDKWIPDWGGRPAIIDLKSVTSLDSDDITKSIYDFGWHRQGAIYTDGIRALGLGDPDFILVFVRKTYPFGVAVRQLGDRSLAMGRADYQSILAEWKRCQETGIYRAFGDDVEEVDCPEWALKRFEKDSMVA